MLMTATRILLFALALQLSGCACFDRVRDEPGGRRSVEKIVLSGRAN